MSKYIKYVITNTEPIRIADDSSSQNGQTSTLRYIPGTTIRGLVINQMVHDADFEEVKKVLLSEKVRYLNAYPFANGHALIPSPMGFYEDKTVSEDKKAIENVVVSGEFSEGYKRASLGRYCYVEDGCIYYYNVETGSDLKIKFNLEENEKQNVFRNEYIARGQKFVGYVAVDDDAVFDRIQKVFQGEVLIGNARTSGLGKCVVEECSTDSSIPYTEYMPKADINDECYIVLMSNMTMRDDNGEICGIDIQALESAMGVSNLAIESCSTSTVNVRGYNRVWGVKTPSAVMYAQGSVFKLSYSGTLSLDKMLKIANQGIGIRKNEGFGRVIFMDCYPSIQYKLAGKTNAVNTYTMKSIDNAEDLETLKNAAKAYYMNRLNLARENYIAENALVKGSISNSKIGKFDAIVTAYRFEPKKGVKVLQDFMKHDKEKESTSNIHKVKSSAKTFSEMVNSILNVNVVPEEVLGIVKYETIMGIKKEELISEDEIIRWKLQLISDLIRFENKREGK